MPFAATGLVTLAGCYPPAIPASSDTKVHLTMDDGPPGSSLYAYGGSYREGRRTYLRYGQRYCADSPCETDVPGGSRLLFDMPGDAPQVVFDAPASGSAHLHIDKGSSRARTLAPWALLVGSSVFGLGSVVLGSGIASDVNGHSGGGGEVVGGGIAAGVGLAVVVAAVAWFVEAHPHVKVEPGLRF